MQYLHLDQVFSLDSGAQLPRITITFQTFGQLNARRDNVVWICHALTGNSDVPSWWAGLVGKGCLIDPEKYFIVCSNAIGSCNGSTGPDHCPPGSTEAWGLNFPLLTTRDMARVHVLLAQHLGIQRIYLGIGGSMGGQQLLEWTIMEQQRFVNVCLLATNARHSPWGIAFNEAQRMAMQADPTLGTTHPQAGRKGLEAARAVAMLSYRHYQTYDATQSETDDKLDDFRAGSYQRYQGQKLWERFSPLAYWTLSKTMDSHNVGRGRGGVVAALGTIRAKVLVIGVDTDVLFPVAEQSELAEYIPGARFEIIHSNHGHDGFLTETKAISHLLKEYLDEKLHQRQPAPLLRKQVAFRQNYALPGSESF